MYYLQLEYGNKIISIPFGNELRNIDNYTMQFKDRLVFLDRKYQQRNKIKQIRI